MAADRGWIGSSPARAVSVRTAPDWKADWKADWEADWGWADWEADWEPLDILPPEDLRRVLKAAWAYDNVSRAEAIVPVLLFRAPKAAISPARRKPTSPMVVALKHIKTTSRISRPVAITTRDMAVVTCDLNCSDS